jgi:hypothetical protein
MAGKNDEGKETYSKEEVQKMVQEGAAAAAKAAVDALMPAMAAVSVQNRQTGQVASPQQGGFPRVPVIRCNECGQDKRACKSGHKQMCVYPTRYPEFAEWFMGVYINGVRYLSDRPGHLITVPADAESGILTHIRVWEDNERTTKLGKKRRHNSGDAEQPNRNLPYFR